MDSINGFVWNRKQKVSDTYCWTCHKLEPTLFCASCVRAFHKSPACSHSKQMTAEAMQSWRCPECCAIEKDEQHISEMKIDTVYVNKVLKLVSDRILDDEWLQEHFFCKIDYTKCATNVVCPMDLLKIAKKNDDMEYRSWEAFMADIKWIVHNAKAYFDTTKVARDWVMELARGELLSIRLCHECYVNANEHPAEWMSMVCNGHHPVIWAKLNTWPHWPAKLVGRNEEDLTVFVQFFGDKTSGAPISSTNCTKYTEHCPSSHLGKHKDALIEAQAAAKVYIDKLNTKCGPEIMSDPKIPKPKPARRLTICGHDHSKPRSSAVASARIMNRRMTNLDPTNANTNTNIINHQRQRVQLGRIKLTNQKMPVPSGTVSNLKVAREDSSVERSKLSETLAKKRKIDENSMHSKTTPTSNAIQSGQRGDFAEKNGPKSEFVLPMTAFNPKAAPSHQSTVVNDTPAAANDVSQVKGASKFVQPISVSPTSIGDQRFGSLAKSETESDGKEATSKSCDVGVADSLNIKSSPESMMKCKNIVENAMKKYNELTRSSFEAVILGILNNHEIELRSAHDALQKQRLAYDDIVEKVRAQNMSVKDQCTLLQAQNAKQNSQLKIAATTADAAKIENDDLKAQLKDANGKIAALNANVNKMVDENAEMCSKVKKLQKSNDDLSTTQQVLHQKLQQSMAEIQKASQDMASNGRAFNQYCDDMKKKFDGLNSNKEAEMKELRQKLEQQKHWHELQVRHMHNNFEQKKNDAIAETKKRPWCLGCGSQGGPYYCTDCEIRRIYCHQHSSIIRPQNFSNRPN